MITRFRVFPERLAHITEARARFWLASIVLATCLLLGGRGPHNPVASAICLLAAVVLLAFELAQPKRMSGPGATETLAIGALVILLSSAVIPLLQVVPLPSGIWQALPGRGLLVETLKTAGLPLDPERPLTYDSLMTTGAALHVLPTLAMFISVNRMDTAACERLFYLLLAAAFASLMTVLLPVGQLFDALLAEPARSGALYSGFFANRNHQADLLLIAIVGLACLQAMNPSRSMAVLATRALIACLLIMGVLATTSRMGFALLGPVLCFSAAMIWRGRTFGGNGGSGRIVLISGFAGMVAWAVSLTLLPRILDRIGIKGLEDLRFEVWPDIIRAIGQFFPAGSGIGTFDQVFRTTERLDQLSYIYMNQAHNEYLQVLLEGGLPGGLVLLAALIWFMFASVIAWKKGDHLARAGSIVLGIYLLHSVFDYPLRTLSHAALLGVFVALLSAKNRDRTSASAQD